MHRYAIQCKSGNDAWQNEDIFDPMIEAANLDMSMYARRIRLSWLWIWSCGITHISGILFFD